VCAELTCSQKARMLLCDLSRVQAAYAAASVSRSLLPRANRALALSGQFRKCIARKKHASHWLASSRLSIGLRNRGFEDRHAATVSCRTGQSHGERFDQTTNDGIEASEYGS
jgi:hypothetical protein